MKFVFSFRFYVLFAMGLVPLSLSWNMPWLRTLVFVYDALLIIAAVVDHLISRTLPEEFTSRREFDKRFAIGDPTQVKLHFENLSAKSFRIKVKDEFPPELDLKESREAEFTLAPQSTAEFSYAL